MIPDCNLVYTTWQPFGPALLVDSPLLSYIDIWHANFLPPSLTIDEARDLDPRYITVEDPAPVRDESTERVSRSHRVHVPIKEPEALVQVIEPTTAESIQSSGAEFDSGEEEMVIKGALTVDRFMSNAQSAARQQEPQSRDPNPPPPPPPPPPLSRS